MVKTTATEDLQTLVKKEFSNKQVVKEGAQNMNSNNWPVIDQ